MLVEGIKQTLNIGFGSDTRNFQEVWELCFCVFVEKVTHLSHLIWLTSTHASPPPHCWHTAVELNPKVTCL